MREKESDGEGVTETGRRKESGERERENREKE